MAESKNTPLELHRQAWLDAHPERDEVWLRRMAVEGFDVHHVDGDHENNDPLNLVLIEHRDHFMLHSGGRPRLGRLSKPWGNEKPAAPPCWWDEHPIRRIRLDKPHIPVWHAMRSDKNLRPTEKETRELNAFAEYERNLCALVRRCENM